MVFSSRSIKMSPHFVLGRENVPCVAEVVNRSLKADCTDFKQWEISLVFSYIVIKEEIKDKKLWFQLTTSFRLLQLTAQSIFVRL